jgi:hypothetical protein
MRKAPGPATEGFSCSKSGDLWDGVFLQPQQTPHKLWRQNARMMPQLANAACFKLWLDDVSQNLVIVAQRLAVGVRIFALRGVPPEVEGDVDICTHSASDHPFLSIAPPNPGALA